MKNLLCEHARLLETPEYLHWVQKVSDHPGDQVFDFQLRSFVDPKPVKLGESYTANRI